MIRRSRQGRERSREGFGGVEAKNKGRTRASHTRDIVIVATRTTKGETSTN